MLHETKPKLVFLLLILTNKSFFYHQRTLRKNPLSIGWWKANWSNPENFPYAVREEELVFGYYTTMVYELHVIGLC